MEFNIKVSERLGEKVYEYIHPSGLKLIVAQKEGYFEKYVMFSTNYGSIDSVLINKSGETLEVPDGIAHFLEHKLFEKEDGSIMDKFAALGSRPNAFTSFTKTSYLFSCTSEFEENFRMLIDFVQHPYLTDENVEKEKGIIGQEINMYRDNPDWMVMVNYLNAMYFKNNVRKSIAGSIESISKINKELLYLCYNTFYHPKNMIITVAGDVDPQNILNLLKSSLDPKWLEMKDTGYSAFNEEEPSGIKQNLTRMKMQVSTPIYMIGFKDDNNKISPMQIAKKEICTKIALEILFGKSSDFYERNYNSGIINDSFYYAYENDRSFAFSYFGGESKEPEKVSGEIRDTISYATNRGIDKDDFERIKNNMQGSFVKRFNSVEGTCRQYSEAAFEGIDLFEYFSLYDTITLTDIELIVRNQFDDSKMVTSIIDTMD